MSIESRGLSPNVPEISGLRTRSIVFKATGLNAGTTVNPDVAFPLRNGEGGRLKITERHQYMVRVANARGELENLPKQVRRALRLKFLSPDGSIPSDKSIALGLRKAESTVRGQISTGIARLKTRVLAPDSLTVKQSIVQEAFGIGYMSVLGSEQQRVLTARFLSPNGNIVSYRETAIKLKKGIGTIKNTELIALEKLTRTKAAWELIAGQDQLSIGEQMAILFLGGLNTREIAKIFKTESVRVEIIIRDCLISLGKDSLIAGLLQKPEK